ncbi:hypothetical protein CLM82_10260, partial [Streptomyces albidoflavus]
IGEAVRVGRSFALVAPNPEDPATPLITAEDATQAIVAYRAGSGRVRPAGLKCWLDDWGGRLMATLYLPDAGDKSDATAPRAGQAGRPR